MSDLSKTQVVPRAENPSLTGGADADAILADIGKNFRRVDSTNRTDKDGLRAVWHQSKLRTDMLSWERKDRTIERQELCFFGKMVEFRVEGGLRTGDLPSSLEDEDNGPRISRSQLFKPARELDIYVLDAASRILRASKRDYYTQHLLGHVNTALQKLEKNVMRTQMHGLEFFREIEIQGRDLGNEPPAPKRSRTMMVVWSILGLSLTLAAVVFWILFTRKA